MALTIAGSPSSLAVAGKSYSFVPSATDTSGKTKAFKITNKPSWAAFNSSTGQLSGTPSSTAVGYYYNIGISVSDGTSTVALKPFTVHVEAADKTPPVISGVPSKTVAAGSAYSFRPTATDPAGNSMWFQISNKPAWATFNISNGSLTGTPTATQVGTYSNIVIHANDGQMQGSTSAFSITVTPASAGTGTGAATLAWTAPTKNTNGSSLTDLGGYHLHYGTSASNLSAVVQVASASAHSYTVKNLSHGTWYFGLSAYTTTGVESGMSQVVSAVVN